MKKYDNLRLHTVVQQLVSGLTGQCPYDGKETPSAVLFVLLVSTHEYYRMVKEFLRKIFLDSSYLKSTIKFRLFRRT